MFEKAKMLKSIKDKTKKHEKDAIKDIIYYLKKDEFGLAKICMDNLFEYRKNREIIIGIIMNIFRNERIKK